MITLAILVALMSIALPSFGDAMARARLRTAAEDLALGLGNARLESVRAGAGTVHVTVAPGATWCWAVGPVAGVDCTNPPSGSTLHVVHGADYPGIRMIRGVSTSFDGRNTLASAGFAAEFVSANGGALRVNVTPLGRASICAPEGRSLDYPRCI
ncbi:MAG: pilus assembly protein FimT [Burkholderiaceae bacterium]|nr:pilus assembly protein FimT [Burkholderiaceae bacterium]